MDLDNIRNDLLCKRYTNEIEYLETNQDNNNDNITRIKILKDLLSSQTKNNKKSTLDELREDLNKTIYNKPWHRLNNFAKLVKIKEYITEFNIDNTLKEKIIKDFENLVESNKLKTKYVDYDQTLEKIILIKKFAINDNKKEYSLNI